MYWYCLQLVKRVMLATTLSFIIFLAVGCGSVKSLVVTPGSSQYPHQIRPLIFLNLSVQSDLNWSIHGKVPLRICALLLENIVTHKKTVFTFDSNIFLSESKTAPYKVDDATNTVISPVLITLEPGSYIIESVDIDAIRSGTGVREILLDFPDSVLKLDIPDKVFVSLGTLSVVLSDADSSLLRKVFDGGKIKRAKRSALLRKLSGLENAFAVHTYPFLKDVNLVSVDNK